MRAGLRMIVDGEPDMRVVAEARDARDAVAAAGRVAADVAIAGMLDGDDAIELAGRLTDARRPAPSVILLAGPHAGADVARAFHSGAAGFLVRDLPPDDLVRAVRAVAAGDAVVAPRAARRLVDWLVEALPPPAAPRRPELSLLTQRETEVLLHIARGRTNAQIARALTISEATVKSHVYHLLTKLHLRDRVEAVVLAYETGLVRPSGAPGAVAVARPA